MSASLARKTVIKLEIAGAVTSFCLPHFKQGMQPTYDMPPPSTIYGHICSAVGSYVDAASIEFGYRFVHEGKFIDYKEHLYFNEPLKLFPFNRELLFRPHLTLYLSPLELLDALREPHYAVCLGRSQDLMTYRSLELVELQRAEAGYFEHTLLPHWMGPRLGADVVSVTMPRYIRPNRTVDPAAYVMVFDPVFWPAAPNHYADVFGEEDDDGALVLEADAIDLWIDPTSPPAPKHPDLRRAIWFHRFIV